MIINKKILNWYWYWGFNQDELQIHSPKLKFTDFDKMKEHSATHSSDYKWIGSGYWSSYDTVDTGKNTMQESIPPTVCGWVEIKYVTTEYNRILALSKTTLPIDTSSSLHIFEERYLIEGHTYRFLYPMAHEDEEDVLPTIEIYK